MAASLRFERLGDTNLEDALELYNSVFRKRASLDYLRRKYDTAYTGLKHITYLAYDGSTPVGFYGALPQVFTCDGSDFIGVHTCDSITHPQYQGRGVHRDLALRAYDLMRDHGVKLVYAFHSEATFHACKKLSWSSLQRMRGFRIPVRTLPVATMCQRLPGLVTVFDRRARAVLARFADQTPFVNSNQGEGAMCVRYSPEFFRYKSFSANGVVRAGPIRAWVKVAGGLMIGDLEFVSEADLWAGLPGLQALARRIGCNHILFQTFPGSRLERCLSRRLQSFDSWLVGYLTFDPEVPVDRWLANFGDLDTF
jgi:GNAT superfamily N-acetyltransferase